MDMGVHCIDLIRYVTGQEVKKVAAFNKTHTFSYEVEDQSSVLMELSDGTNAYVEAHFDLPDITPSCFEVYGTKGYVRAYGTLSQVDTGTVEGYTIESDDVYDAQQTRAEGNKLDFNVEFGNMYTRELDSFGRSHRDGAEIEVPAEDAIKAQKVIAAAYESTETGRIISL